MAATQQKYPAGAERLATLALWAIPGIGPKTLSSICATLDGDIRTVLSVPVREWAGAVKLPLPVRRLLAHLPDLAELAHRLIERAKRAGIGIAFPGDQAFPPNLVGLEDSPPLLFYQGTPSAPRRRIAMVGSRHPEQGFLPFARRFASEVAQAGTGVVSGAAEGVDRACHWGALTAGGETWAFLGSALDELDPPQATMLPHFLARGGMFYSELPLGVRASAASFPRRNRLISGAADAVLILRAGVGSGAMHTVAAAEKQNRPLLAMPGNPANPSAASCNALIRAGRARVCMEAEDVYRVLGWNPRWGVRPAPAGKPLDFNQLSDRARRAYQALDRLPRSLDEVASTCQLRSADLISGLCELELMGLIIQHPGRRYEKV